MALADAGTPLIWAKGFHILLGNLLLGAVEALIISLIFRLQFKKCLISLVCANYFSAWIGFYIIGYLRELRDPDIYTVMHLTRQLIILSYFLTLVLEWPFIMYCIRKVKLWFIKSIAASIIVQTVTYVALFGGYRLCSVLNLYDDFTIVPPSEIVFPEGIAMYYISCSDGNVYLYKPSQESDTLIYTLDSSDIEDHLVLLKSDSTKQWDLSVSNEYHTHRNAKIILPSICESLSEDMTYYANSYDDWNAAPKVGEAANSSWQFCTSHWAGFGFWGNNKATNERIRVAFETPVSGWRPKRVIHLPEEKIIFQLGDKQICILDIDSKRIALLIRGYGPMAININDMPNKGILETARARSRLQSPNVKSQ